MYRTCPVKQCNECSRHEIDYRWKHYTGFSMYDKCPIELKSKGKTPLFAKCH
jgi:hypothetical protein